MAKPGAASKKRPVEQYEHKGKKRTNNPPVGLVDARNAADLLTVQWRDACSALNIVNADFGSRSE